MNLNNNPARLTLCFALVLCVFTCTYSAQKTSSDQNGYLTGKQENAGSTGIRTPERQKSAVKNKPTESEIQEMEKLAVTLINRKRAEFGLPAVDWSDEVAKVARLHSENMAKFNFFGHRGADGKTVNDRADSFGLTKWTLIGENIAYNRGYPDPVEAAVEKWMQSAAHRENILNERWRETAVGIAVSDEGAYYFTQVFIKRK